MCSVSMVLLMSLLFFSKVIQRGKQGRRGHPKREYILGEHGGKAKARKTDSQEQNKEQNKSKRESCTCSGRGGRENYFFRCG